MSNKIHDVAESIKSKLSFDDYTPSPHKNVMNEGNNTIIMANRKAVKKVKRTFYIQERIADHLDALYAKKLMEKEKIDKSDIVTQALVNLFENNECEIQRF